MLTFYAINYLVLVRARIFMDHYKTSHGRGENGTEDDLILLKDVMKEIDAYEAKNNLQLGPPLMSNFEDGGGMRKKFNDNTDANLENSKGELF